MPLACNFLALFWWAAYTVVAVWAQKVIPGVDFLAPGLVLSMQEEAGYRTVWLAVLWILLQEGMGNLPFGYGIAWYGLLVIFYIVGAGFRGRSFCSCACSVSARCAASAAHIWFVGLGQLAAPQPAVLVEGALQALLFPLVWAVADWLFPTKLRQDVTPF